MRRRARSRLERARYVSRENGKEGKGERGIGAERGRERERGGSKKRDMGEREKNVRDKR